MLENLDAAPVDVVSLHENVLVFILKFKLCTHA